MILKMSHTNKESGKVEWTWYDNIVAASSGYDEKEGCRTIAILPRGQAEYSVLPVRNSAYLCNDDGKTIEAFYPDIKRSN